LTQLHRVHRGNGEAERRKLVGLLADRDRPVLQPLETGALRLQGNSIDLIEQKDLGRRQWSEFRNEFARRRVDHLEADDLGWLQVGPTLEARELRAADRGQDDPEECLPDSRYASKQQVAGVDLALVVLVVRGRYFRQQDHVGERFLALVSHQRLATFGDDGLMKVDGFLKI
jgi:hypothetical protein